MQAKSQAIDKKSLPFIIPVVLLLGIFIGVGAMQVITSLNSYSQNSTSSVENSQYVNDIYNLIKSKYLGSIPEGKNLDYAKIKGIIDSLDSKYTSFLTPEEAKEYKKSQNPNFEGIGVTLKFDGQNTIVETVLKNYPAEKAGIQIGDTIAKVDDQNVMGEYPADVASKIRGQSGTKVKVEISRENNSNTLSFEITRESIDIDNISYQRLDNGIYKINIYQFVDTSPEALNNSWDKIVNEINSNNDAKGIIIDLRNNPGGYVYSVKHIMEEFFKNGTILFKERQKDSAEQVYQDYRVGKFEDLPLTVIVNEGSASASEIFASAVQDNNRGKIVGEKTVGKGVEQEIEELNDGSLLILVFQQWLTPKDRNITPEDPVTPDFEVNYTQDDFKNLKDPQLEKALDVLM